MSDCIFCQIICGNAPSWKVYEDENVYAFLDTHPVNEYHTLVIPKPHYENIFDFPADKLIHLIAAVKKIAMLYHQKLEISNIQIINSSGIEAQQDVLHLHFHIIPRYFGDHQNLRWTTHPEWVARFDGLLDFIKE